MSKICSKCGTKNPLISNVCLKCGESLADAVKSKTVWTWEKVWNVIGAIVGIAIIICGIVMITEPDVTCSSISYAKYGADFYTDIYDAVRSTAHNITYAAEAIVRGLGFVTVSIGAFMTCYFGKSLKS